MLSCVSTNRFKLNISSQASHALSTVLLEAADDDDEDRLVGLEACFVRMHKHVNYVTDDSFVSSGADDLMSVYRMTDSRIPS